MNLKYLIVVCLAGLIIMSQYVASALFVTDNTAVAVPSDNGTSTMLNITARMQQYVGFFGVINSTVKLNTGAGNILYQKPVTSGKIYFFKNGATPTGALVPALNNSQTDANFSLSGYYATGNHFVNNATVCGVSLVNHLNTTDNYAVGIMKDSAANPNFFICTDIRPVTSANGMGAVTFEAVVPKTSSYASYDVYVDLE